MSNSDIPKITAAQGSHMPPIEYRLHLPEVKDGSQAPPKDFESRMHEAIKKAVAYEQHRATALTRLGQYHQKQRAAIIGGAAEKLAAPLWFTEN